MVSRVSRAIAVVAGLAGVAIVVLAGTRIWASVTLPGLTGMDALPLPGRQAAPVVMPVALAAGAAVIVMAITGRIVRFLVAALLVAGGVIVVLASQDARQGSAIAARRAVESTISMFNQNSAMKLPAGLYADAQSDLTIWPLVSLGGGILLVASGLLGLVTGPRWPGPSSRYEAAGTPGRTAAAGAPAGTSAGAHPPAADDARTWDALSRGDDPT